MKCLDSKITSGITRSVVTRTLWTTSRAFLSIAIVPKATTVSSYKDRMGDSIRSTSMGHAAIIDGKALADRVIGELSQYTNELLQNKGIVPRMVIIQVGDNTESSLYIRAKQRAAQRAGIDIKVLKLDKASSALEIKNEIGKLNSDPAIHGIIIQLPMPKGFNEQDILDTISPKKDIDALTSVNIGRLSNIHTEPAFLPCTAKAVIRLLESTNVEIEGKRAVVIGRSTIVGMPTSTLLTRRNATVTLCHSKTRDIVKIVGEADILVVAIGCLKYIQGAWIKPGAVVIDVGINEIEDSTKKTGRKICGDIDFENAKLFASAITPVPGGVGPMTVAMLLENTIVSVRNAQAASTQLCDN